MKLTIWDLFRFLYKHKLMIAAGTICSVILANMYVGRIQTYSAEIVIKYKDACISKGNSPDGSIFDSGEIVSPKVVSYANKALPFKITEDGIRANTKIIPIVPDSEKKLQESKQKLGEEHEYYPNTFRIRYKGGSSFNKTRDTLDKLINSYFKYYNEKYLYLATVSEIDYDLNNGAYDYIEQAEILQDNIQNAVSVLQGYVGNNEYRSPSTGLTFKDIQSKFNNLSEYKIPLIFSQIYTARLSANPGLLINKYTERREANLLKSKNLSEKAQLAEDRMDAYVDANVDVPNSYNYNQKTNDDNVTIIQDIHDGYRENRIQSQTTYDSLIKNYVTDSVSANHNIIDANHCAYVVDVFSTAPQPGIDYASYEAAVKTEIKDMLSELKALYKTTFKIIDDYNAYVPAQHIECLTGVRYYENVYASFYYLVAAVIGFSLFCLIAVSIEIIKKYAAYAAAEKTDNNNN